MNPDPTSSGQSWFNVLFGMLFAIGGWFINRYTTKVDALEKQQATCVTREELKAYLAEIKADHVRMHEENLENWREIRTDLKDFRK